jgi:hypothetical protein
MASNMDVANTILEQLGGRMFCMMTGSKNFVAGDNSLRFKPGSSASKINYCKITLGGDDPYKVEFGKVRKMDLKIVGTEEGVYFDQLQKVFTKYTGMDTSMGRIVNAKSGSVIFDPKN